MGTVALYGGAVFAADGPAIADLVTTVDAHTAAVNTLAMSWDGTSLISGSKDGHIRVWDAASGAMTMDIPACMVAINDIAIDPNGLYVATASEDGYVKVWDAVDLSALLQVLDAHVGGPESSGLVGRFNETVRSAHGTTNRYAAERVPSVFSANAVAINSDQDQPLLFTGGDDGFVRCYSLAEGFALVWEVYAHERGVNDIVTTPDGAYIFSGGVDGKVKIFNAQTGMVEKSVLAYEQGEVRCLAISLNENCLVTGGSNGEVRVWDGWTGALVKKIRAHAGNVNAVGFSAQGSYLLSGGEDGKVRLWNMHAELAGEAQAHVLGVRSFTLGHDLWRPLMYTAGSDFKVRVWNPNFKQ
jgi:WD40 repeat protein